MSDFYRNHAYGVVIALNLLAIAVYAAKAAVPRDYADKWEQTARKAFAAPNKFACNEYDITPPLHWSRQSVLLCASREALDGSCVRVSSSSEWTSRRFSISGQNCPGAKIITLDNN